MSPLVHARHFRRFYIAMLIGLAAWAVMGLVVPTLAPLAAGDTFFAAYLLLMSVFVRGVSADDLRLRADVEDEGAPIIFVLTLIAITFCLGSIFTLGSKPERVHLIIALASVPLGWLTLHTVMAFHYARVHYARSPLAKKAGSHRQDRGGLSFPGTEEPGAWDFLYFSYTLGMTAQTSDVQIETGEMRKLVLAHSVLSFFFNTVLLALAVNVAVSAAQP